jgi:hypothetical protein
VAVVLQYQMVHVEPLVIIQHLELSQLLLVVVAVENLMQLENLEDQVVAVVINNQVDLVYVVKVIQVLQQVVEADQVVVAVELVQPALVKMVEMV